MGLSTSGVGSGLDIKAIVDSLVNAAITPAQTRQDTQLKSVNTELSAMSQLKSSLATLQTSLSNLSDLDKLYAMKYSLSDPAYFTPTLTSSAVKGIYQVEVQQLAQQHTLATGYFATNTTSIGSGTITINFGTYNSDKTTFTANSAVSPLNINIAPGSDSLIAVRDAINNTKSGVTATIVQDTNGSRLTLSSVQTGENYAMQISGDLSALNYDPTIGNNTLSETLAAQNSIVRINGLTLNQSTNQLDNAISGTTLNLKKAETGKIISLSIDDNTDQVAGLINDFVKKYNDTISFLTNLTGYNTETKQRGIYQTDPQFRSLKLNLNKWATTPLNNNFNSLHSLADLGIITNKDGLLEVKQTQFDKILKSNYADIGALFAKSANATDTNIRINSFNSKVKAGTYNVNLTEYTPGVSMSGSIGSLAATSSDGLTLHGSGQLSSLSIDVLSGSTGSRGQIIINDGIAVAMNSLLDSFTKPKGDLNQRTEQLNKQVTLLTQSQEKIDQRKESYERRYSLQFNRLDGLLAKLQGDSNALTQLLSRLPSKNS